MEYFIGFSIADYLYEVDFEFDPNYFICDLELIDSNIDFDSSISIDIINI